MTRTDAIHRVINGSSIVLSIVAGAIASGIILARELAQAPVLILLGAGLIAVAAILVQTPQLTLAITIMVRILPDAAQIEPLYSIGVYGLVLLAVTACLIDLVVKRQELIWNGVFSLLCIYLIWLFTSLIWTPDPIAGARWIGTYCIGLILMVVTVNQVRTAKNIDLIMYVLGVMGWIYLIGGLYTLWVWDSNSSAAVNILGTNVNTYAMFLVLTLPGVIWSALRTQGLLRLAFTVLSCLFVFCALIVIVMTGSRGGVLSIILVLLSFGLHKQLRPWAIVGFICVFSALLAAPFLIEILMSRLNEYDPDGFGGRLTLWYASILLIQDNLLTGVGVGNGPASLHNYIASLTSYYNQRSDLPGHNPILEVAVQSGLVGMALYIAAIGLVVVKFVRSRIDTDDIALGSYRPLVGGCAIAYAVSWMKSGGMENDPSLFLLLSLLLIPNTLSRKAPR